MDNNRHSRVMLWKSTGIFVLLLLGVLAFLYYYDQKQSEEPIIKTELKKTVAKPAEFPKGQMEDGLIKA